MKPAAHSPGPDDLRGRTVRNAVVTVGSQWARYMLSLGGAMAMARLLTPEDFGLFAMVLAVTAFFAAFRDLGLPMATVQRKAITHAQVSTLFWINVGAGAALALVTVGLAPLVAWFYEEPRLTGIMAALAAGHLLTGVSAQPMALLYRRMRFGRVAALELGALIFSLVVGIGLAWQGWGYRALVAKMLTAAAVVAVGVWFMLRWRPSAPRRGTGVRPMLAFGGHLSAGYVFGYLARNLDNILIGRFVGSAALGFYTKAYQIVLMPVSQFFAPLSSAFLPTLSRLQDDPARFRAFYRKGTLMLTSLGMPAIALAFVSAEKVVGIMLGPQWTAVVPLFRMLAPAAFIGTFYLTTDWVYLALGQTRRQLRWTIFAETLTILAFALGIRWGAMGVAAAYTVMTGALWGPGLRYCFRESPLGMRDFASAVWRPATASLGAAAGLFGVRALAPAGGGLLLAFAFDAAVYGLLYFLLWRGMPGGRAEFRAALDLLAVVRGKGRAGTNGAQEGRSR
ncbi:lipopolysaccharide biosynthesis protein [Rhodocaloribacter sp.]